MADAGAKNQTCVFIKKKRPRKGQRKRNAAASQHHDEDDVESAVETVKRPHRAGLSATTKVKLPDDPLTKLDTTFKSTKEAKRHGPADGGATMISEHETQFDRDAQAIFEKQRQINEANGETGDDKLYKGQAGYQQFHEVKDSAAGNAFKSFAGRGPQRAPQHIRSTVRWDYQPDICKDYKETGYCGFGDTCKFLHDRSDYKSGWQIDREIESGEYNAVDVRQYQIEDSSDEEEELPFACFICRNAFTTPVVTKCKHYFCEKCALSHYRKTKKCFVCNEPTNGVFMPAKEIIARMKKEEAAAKEAEQDDVNDSTDLPDNAEHDGGGGETVHN